MPSARPPALRRNGLRRTVGLFALSALVGSAALAGGAVSATAAPIDPGTLPPQEPGVTLRTFQVPNGISALCTLRGGTTPNVDKLMPVVDFTTDADFGLVDNFLTHVRANLTVAEAGGYGFRITSDDGSRVSLGGEQILLNDGFQDSTSVETTVTLEPGAHELFVEHFEGGYGQRLLLQWKPPGATTWATIPSSNLSTDAGVVRVTAPGTKYCEGAEDTAGDGLQLDSVNPNYTLTDLRPADFEPKVSGLAFTADDELLVTTTGSVSAGGWVPDAEPGEVFLLDGVVDATGPQDVTATKIATDLLNPMGIDVIDDLVYVSERDQLTELSDPDGDGFYDTHRTVATWPDGGNFHEFAFGLIHDEENFYVNLSVAIDNGGATTNPQPAQGRGTTLRIDRESGEVEVVAGGLRTPNGIAFGPDGEIFAMDNQGGWLPSSKLVHVEDGRFFNHYTNPAGPFDDEPVTPPALWIPQNEIGNSPSTPILLDEGPFAGQMVFGDVTYGGLQRAFLEEVDGEYQGAVFRHTAGLEVGVNRVITGPDGALYVGGTGEGGNWGESGKLVYGLQKLSPINTDTFDMESVSAVEGGFEITYTEPISTETAASLATAYRAEQWRYVPTAAYGGPKVNEQVLGVSSATVSEDRTTVTIQLDGLEPGNVVHLRSPRPFESESGKELWSTEAWYTLNSLPGYEAPADRGWYEAEFGQITGTGGIDTEHNGYSGDGFVDGFGDVGTGVTFPVTVDEAGTYPINLRYANGPNPYQGEKDVSLYVNGEKVGPWALSDTGAWNSWGVESTEVALRAGVNAVKIQYDEGDDGNVNIDLLTVGDGSDICAPAEVEAGYTSLFDGTLAQFEEWNMAGPGSFGRQADCSLRGSGGLGLLWHDDELAEYSLKLDWKLSKDDNGGVFVGFPDPGTDPWVAVNQGYEIQIDATDEDDRTTGAIYTFQGADLAAVEANLNPVGAWNAYEIVVEGQTIKVFLNGVLVNDFTSTDPARDLSSGFIGIQNHGAGEAVNYRNVRVMDLAERTAVTPAAVTFADVSGTQDDTFTVPATEGVEYLAGGDVVAAGTYPGTGTVTVTARATEGFVLVGGVDPQWSYTFDDTVSNVVIPTEQVSIGMYSLKPWVDEVGVEPVVDRLSSIGLENIEPYGGTFGDYTALEFRNLADELGLAIPSSHYDVAEDTFDETLDFVSTLGQSYVGSGGFPAPGLGGFDRKPTYDEVIQTAAAMDRLGQRSVEAGVGKIFGHNHSWEFTTSFEVDGVSRTAWEILVEKTNPEYVTFQLDVAWAAHAGMDVVDLLDRYDDRVELLHVKDATGLVTQERPTFVNLGEGDVPLQEILAKGQEIGVDYFVMEYDLAPDGEDFVAEGFEYLTGVPAGEPNDTEPTEPVVVPTDQVSIGMFSLLPWTSQAGVGPVLERLSSIGFENVEPFGANFAGYTAPEFRALTDRLGLNVPTSHYDVEEDTFDETLQFVGTLGQRYVGSGGFADPGISSYENVLATAATMNRLGERSVAAGLGKFFGHNHDREFTTTYEHEGEVRSAWEILVMETNPEWVTFQVDVAWATHAGVNVPALLQEHGDRIDLLHIKDAVNLGGTPAKASPTFVNLGQGRVPLQAILAEAQEQGVDIFTMEYDLAAEGESFASEGFEYLTGLEAGDPTPVPFTDVPVLTQFFDEISWLFENGISTGWETEAGREFRPLQPIARDAMAAFLYRQAGSPEFTGPPVSPFTDVSTDNQFYDEISWLAAEGISTGWDNGDGTVSYRPLEPIGRDAMAAFLYRMADSPSFTGPVVSPFTDVAPSNQFYKEITWLVNEGISTGWVGNDGTAEYRPVNPINRDAMAAFLFRYDDAGFSDVGGQG